MRKVVVLLLAALMVTAMTACAEDSVTIQEDSTTQEVSSETEQDEGQVIYEDDYLKATYQGVSESFGYIVMTVSLENKSDGEISVLPMDSSVDDTMVQFTSGTMATIQAGKTFNQGWLIGSMPTEKVEFAMYIYDENMSEIEHTDILTVEME